MEKKVILTNGTRTIISHIQNKTKQLRYKPYTFQKAYLKIYQRHKCEKPNYKISRSKQVEIT